MRCMQCHRLHRSYSLYHYFKKINIYFPLSLNFQHTAQLNFNNFVYFNRTPVLPSCYLSPYSAHILLIHTFAHSLIIPLFVRGFY